MTTPVRRPDRWEIRQVTDHVERSWGEAQILDAQSNLPWDMFQGTKEVSAKRLRVLLADACIERKLAIVSCTPVHYRVYVRKFLLSNTDRPATAWLAEPPTRKQIEEIELDTGYVEVVLRVEALVVPMLARAIPFGEIVLDGDGTHHFR